MSTIFEIIADGFLDIWYFLRGKQREVDESSMIGQSEFEKEGPGMLWALIISGGLLALVVLFVLLH